MNKNVENRQCCGRSMIEMLGVLAIIGVLSVGGIAGYSKAMQMYKLNKWKSDFIYMMTNMKTSYLNSKTYSDKSVDLLPLIKELDIIPQNMLTADNKDIFGNKLFVGVRPMVVNWGVPLRFAIRLDTLPNKDSVEQCKILFDFLNYFEDAWIVALNENTGSNRHYVCGKASTEYYYTHIGCKPYNWSEIAKKCSVCATQICDIKFLLNNNN